MEGRIRSRSWDDQNGQKRYVTEIQADTIQLLGRRSENPAAAPSSYAQPQQPQAHTQPQQTTPMVNPADLTDDGTDDLPF